MVRPALVAASLLVLLSAGCVDLPDLRAPFRLASSLEAYWTVDEGATSVAVDGDRAAIGVQGAPVAGVDMAGIVDVWHLAGGTWTREARLQRPDPAHEDRFGYAVALDGPHLAVVAAGSYQGGVGALHLFERIGGAWVEQDLAPLPAGFGPGWEAPLLSGGHLVVVAEPLAFGQQPRHVYAYHRTGAGWQGPTLVHAFGEGMARPDVALDGGTLVVGDPRAGRSPIVCSRQYVSGQPVRTNHCTVGELVVHEWADGAWRLAQRIDNLDPAVQTHFGSDVALGEGWIAATSDERGAGALLHLFRREGASWVHDRAVREPETTLEPRLVMGGRVWATGRMGSDDLFCLDGCATSVFVTLPLETTGDGGQALALVVGEDGERIDPYQLGPWRGGFWEVGTECVEHASGGCSAMWTDVRFWEPAQA